MALLHRRDRPAVLEQRVVNDTIRTPEACYDTALENSEVLLLGSVAVAVTKWVPTGSEEPMKVKAAMPCEFVV